MTGPRQAALVLHGLAERDREWMLSQLADEQAGELRALLTELHELGIPADAADIPGAVPVDGGQTADLAKTDLTLLADASAQQMHTLLVGEPDRLLALALSSSAWPWKERLLGLLGMQRAQRILELAARSTCGAAMRRAVLHDLARRLALLPAQESIIEPRTRPLGWARIRHRLHAGWATWRR